MLHTLFPLAPDKRTYRVAEVADILGCSRMTIYRAIDNGEITAIRLGKRHTIIPRAVLIDYITSSTLDPHA